MAPASDRLKQDEAITVDRVRALEPPGGIWDRQDPVTKGRVHIVNAGRDNIQQAQAAVQELLRLSALDPSWRWDRTAVIARNWATLNPIRAVALSHGIETHRAMDDFTATWQLKETQELLRWTETQSPLVQPEATINWVLDQPPNRWNDLLAEALLQLHEETAGNSISTAEFREWLAEWARDNRRRQHSLLLTTAHRAKGLEFDHVAVLDGGDWPPRRGETLDDVRRVYYVAMTRAKQTLTLMNSNTGNPFLPLLQQEQEYMLHTAHQPDLLPPPPEATDEVKPLALRDVDLSYAGYRTSKAIHDALARLQPGDSLTVDRNQDPWTFRTSDGVTVGRLSKRGQQEMPKDNQVTAEVLAIARWSRDKSQAPYVQGLKTGEWNVVIPQLTITPP